MAHGLRISQITSKIVEAQRADAGSGGDLTRFLRGRLPAIGIDPDDGVRARATEQFVRSYIMTAPRVMEAALEKANRLGMGDRMGEVLTWVEAYWFDQSDVIPDHLGLVGLLDDAYCCLRLLERVSDEAIAERKKPLVNDDLASANWLAYRLIGEPDNEALEHHVSAALGEEGLLGSLAKLAEHGPAAQRVLPTPKALGEPAASDIPSWAQDAVTGMRGLRNDAEDVVDIPEDPGQR